MLCKFKKKTKNIKIHIDIIEQIWDNTKNSYCLLVYLFLITLYVIVAIFLIAIILFQQGSGSLNISAGQGFKHRADSNPITKITGILGAAFIIIAISLAILMKSKPIVKQFSVPIKKVEINQTP